jgi:hypothetical protein
MDPQEITEEPQDRTGSWVRRHDEWVCHAVRAPGVKWTFAAANVEVPAGAATLDSLATALLEHETLDEGAAYAAAGVSRTAAPAAGPVAASTRSRTDG